MNYSGVVGKALNGAGSASDINARLCVDRVFPAGELLDAKTELLKLLLKTNCGIGSDAHKNALNRRAHLRQVCELASERFKIGGGSGLAMGMGNPSGVLDIGMTLDRTTGVPYIPGSALRGLARAYARSSSSNVQDLKQVDELFGTSRCVGAVDFLDAIPDANCKMKPSVMTPHFPDWYINGLAPGEWMSPVPVSYLVIGSGSFHIDLNGSPDSCRRAFEYLRGGLDELGVGGKTSSGYGWLLPVRDDAP
jgi:CRISPR-associated protein Cmr6